MSSSLKPPQLSLDLDLSELPSTSYLRPPTFLPSNLALNLSLLSLTPAISLNPCAAHVLFRKVEHCPLKVSFAPRTKQQNEPNKPDEPVWPLPLGDNLLGMSTSSRCCMNIPCRERDRGDYHLEYQWRRSAVGHALVA